MFGNIILMNLISIISKVRSPEEAGDRSDPALGRDQILSLLPSATVS